MALQDLTPQLRTRLNRMERAVGWFVLLATLLLVFGFGYYVYTTAQNRGWFKIKAPYYTYAYTAEGINVGDPVRLMGYSVGRITKIETMPAWGWGSEHNIEIEFYIEEPYYGYVWTEGSRAKLQQSGFLAARELEVTRGTNGYATFLNYPFYEKLTQAEAEAMPHPENLRLGADVYAGSNLVLNVWKPLNKEAFDKLAAAGITAGIPVIDRDTNQLTKKLTAVWNTQAHAYEPFVKKSQCELPQDETPALTERAQALVSEIEVALPNILRLTNDIAQALSNTTRLTVSLNIVAESVRPVLTNLSVITENLRNPKGALGEWLITSNLNAQLNTALQNLDVTFTNANTNIVVTIDNINRSLNNLADLTGNLNQQVQANTNILTHISDIVVHTDQLVQGLKRFWLFKHLFRGEKTNAVPAQVMAPSR